MHFDDDVLAKARTEALLKFWGREVTAEVRRNAHGSSQAGGVLAALGLGVSPDDARAVADRLVANGFRDFLNRAPGVEPYFRRREESISCYLDEVVRVVNAHEEQIAQELLGGRRPTRVLSINQASFTYRGARCVFVITTDAGKFLYKPHAMRYISTFGELCESLLPGKASVPHVIGCDDACLCEYVESRTPENDQERCAYYEGLGGYLALAYFLSLTDQHAENILPAGPKFSPIDVETLLLASPAITGGVRFRDDPSLSVRESIASTGMLSYCHDRLVGSLVAGTSGKGIARIGTSTEVVDHIDVIANGFTEAFRKCLRNKPMICDAIRSLADVDLRIIMGPGSFYRALQSRFFKLDGWDEESRLRDMDEILRTTRFNRVNDAVCAHERAILVEHDIPYFTVKAGGVDLMAEGKPIWAGYLAEPLVETAIRRVEEANEADLGWQVGLLRRLVAGMPLMSKTRVPDLELQNEPLAEADALREAGWILHRLYEEQVDCGHGGHAIMAYGNADGSYSPMDASLGWGYAGVGAFAAACLRLGAGDPGQAQELVSLSLDEIARNGRYLSMAPEALSTAEALCLETGIAGQLRALQLIWATTHSDKAQQTYADLLALVDMNNPANASEPTRFGALSELVKVLEHEAPVRIGDGGKFAYWQHEFTPIPNSVCEFASVPNSHTEGDAALPLHDRDDLKGGNADIVEQLIARGQLESAGVHLAAMVARRRETGNYIHKGAWRVPYFDPTLFHGATGVGYELLRYAGAEAIASIFV